MDVWTIKVRDLMPACWRGSVIINNNHERFNGGYSEGAPPLTIPNREVKPLSADGTATVGE